MDDRPKGAPLKILIVDDETGITDLFVELMSDMGYDVKAAGDGEDALRIIPAFQPDVVISDIHMNKINGDELYKSLIQSSPQFKERFIFMTGTEIETKLEEFLAQTKCSIVTKPFDIEELTAIIEQKFREPGPNADSSHK